MPQEDKLIPVNKREDIFKKYLDTPIGDLIEYHNLERKFDHHDEAKMVIGMCMDNRKEVRRPKRFAFVLRSGGANMKNSLFKISYAIAVANIQHMALIGHTNCAMVNLHERKDLFVEGLMKNAGWTEQKAVEHFEQFEPQFEIGDEVDFLIAEAQRLAEMYPKVTIAPLLFKVEDSRLYQIKA